MCNRGWDCSRRGLTLAGVAVKEGVAAWRGDTCCAVPVTDTCCGDHPPTQGYGSSS